MKSTRMELISAIKLTDLRSLEDVFCSGDLTHLLHYRIEEELACIDVQP